MPHQAEAMNVWGDVLAVRACSSLTAAHIS
jgi:hypothetical protein